jgi:hypothetical protein
LLGVSGESGCDLGDRTDQPLVGPMVQVTNLPLMPVPADGVIELKFNSLLLPASVTRQAISLRKAGGDLVESPIIIYDPVLLTVRIQNPNPAGGTWLMAGQPYKVVLGLPVADGSEQFVLRGIDGAQVDPKSATEIPFMATAATFQRHKPDIEFCRDVYSTFGKYCTSGCHQVSSQRPYEALLLDTPEGIIHTALGHVAQEANTGARVGTPGPAGRVFGIDMPIIDPGNPGNSYLVYKMMLLTQSKPETYNCLGYDKPNLLMDGGDLWLEPQQHSLLSNLMTGQMMPPTVPFPTTDDVERVSEWIAQGAHLETCLACFPAADAGPDTGVKDSGADSAGDSSSDAPSDAPTDSPDGG